ncbi:MAG TPA: VWA domain-containing protein, partial [Bryobacteraceae bacterium]|nr:VWA domain-containing protein [Bryobacteraceae bacterium]
MRPLALTLALALGIGIAPHALPQQGPNKESTESVAKPRPRPGASGQPEAAPAPEEEKIPSKFSRKDKEGQPVEGPSFRTDANTVTVEAAVLDNKGNFIPKIPQGNFRILEDGVPQTVSSFGIGEGTMTVAMVIEFSNLYQRYWS